MIAETMRRSQEMVESQDRLDRAVASYAKAVGRLVCRGCGLDDPRWCIAHGQRCPLVTDLEAEDVVG